MASISANFYINESDNRVVDKDITATVTLDVIFKETTDRKKPQLILAYDADLAGSNYCFLNGYYYYITDMQYGQQCLILQLNADLLMTYKTDIKNLDVIVGRSEARTDTDGNPVYNCFLNDDRLKQENRQKVTALEFPTGLPDRDEIILVVNGRG